MKLLAKYTFLAVLLWLIGGVEVLSQLHTESRKALKHYNAAVENYRFLDLDNAKKEVELALKEDSGFVEAHLLTAEMNADKKDYCQAIVSYKEVIRLDPNFYIGALYNLGHLEVLTGKYEDAIIHLNAFLSNKKGKKSLKSKAQRDLKTCMFALDAMKNPVPFDPQNLGPMVNSEYDDYWPSITADNQTLVITRLEPVGSEGIYTSFKKVENFYISKWQSGKWTKASKLGSPINTNKNEGAQSLSADGHFMYYTACNRPEGFGSCDLYFSSKLRGNWSFPVNIGNPVNTKAWEAQPSISTDGRTLFFVSNRPGGQGKMDIWKTTRNNDRAWSEPINLGSTVNSSGNEMSPHIHTDNKTLYFSSDGRTGMGGFDLYITRLHKDSTWSVPENLGYPINTWSDEIGMIVTASGEKAYYSSAFGDTAGKDIYEFSIYPEIRPQPVSYIKGKVFDSKTKIPLNAKFELIELESKSTTMQSFSDNKGEFLVCLPTDMNYALNISKEGYLFYSDNFSLKGVKEISDPFYKEIPLNPIKEGEKSVLRNIFFEYNSYKLMDESVVELNKLASFLKENKKVEIEIHGYTDSRGTYEYNLDLSRKRVKSVYEYLISNSIDAGRLSYKGFGETSPVATNESESGRAQNRRIEFVVKKVNQ